MYNYFVHVITCTKSQLVHDIYIYIWKVIKSVNHSNVLDTNAHKDSLN
jgi:hypothetical protein